MNNRSKITPLYDMLFGFVQMVVEKQPRNKEEFKPLLDQLAGQLVKLLSSKLPFSFFPSFFTSLSIAYNWDF